MLQHIPADQVDHIEVIEGGRPGLEMLGQTVVSNVVRKKVANDKIIVTLSNAVFSNGRNTPGGTVELTEHWPGGRTLSGALSASQYVELAEGDGLDVTGDLEGNGVNRTSVTSSAGGLNAYTYAAFTAPAWRGMLSILPVLQRPFHHWVPHGSQAAICSCVRPVNLDIETLD